jgi:hypothetical protein
MQTRNFLSQALFLTSQFERIVGARCRVPETALQHFWVASRSRFDQWGASLRRCTDQLDQTDYAVDALWHRWTPLLEEILISEVVTRIWSYLLEALDDRWAFHEYGPVGQSAYRAHIDARRRVLNLLLRGRPRALPAIWRLNCQRLSAERWTDLLLSQVYPRDWLGDYAFDEGRVRRFLGSGCNRAEAAAILSAASQAAFARCADVPADHVPFHQRMHAAMLSCLGRELFHGGGHLVSSWQTRLMALTDDTQGLLQQWLDESPGHSDADPPGTSRRYR